MPVDIGGGAQLMLADLFGHSEQRIAHLRLVLNIGHLRAAYAHKGIHIPYRLLVDRFEVLEVVYGQPLVAVVVASVAGVEPVCPTHPEI